MCGRFTTLEYGEVADIVRAIELRAPSPVLSDWPAVPVQVRPRDTAWLIVPETDGRDALSCVPFAIERLNWGFDVDWQKGPLFNTRIESALAGRGMWASVIEHGRCLVPARAFFETHATETAPNPRTGRLVKQPYEFRSSDGSSLLLAAVHAEGRFSVVTTQPNAQVAPVHNRMPLVVRPDEAFTWLFGDYARLADRSDVALHAFREPLAGSRQPTESSSAAGQLSLF